MERDEKENIYILHSVLFIENIMYCLVKITRVRKRFHKLFLKNEGILIQIYLLLA